MINKVYKARINAYKMEIKLYDPSDSEKWKLFQEKFNGVILLVYRGFQNQWALLGWEQDQDEQVKEAFWIAQQIDGVYQDDRERFDKNWSNGKFDPGGTMYFEDECIITVEEV